MKILKTIVFTSFTISTLVFSSTTMANHAWGNYHWERSSNPVEIPLGDNLDSTWDEHLVLVVGGVVSGGASYDWNLSTVLNTTVIPGSTKPRQCRVQAGNVQVCNETYGFNGWLGIAGIATSGDHITAAYVKLNDSYFNTATYDTPEWRQMVTCQEVGHTFGLHHQDEISTNANLNTCMDYTSNPLTNQHPNQHDYDQLEIIYGHLDSSSGGGGGGGGGGGDGGGGGCRGNSPRCNGASAVDILSNIDMNSPAQWGRLVSEHGPQEVYELDFGGGRKVITHVTWTLEHAQKHKH